MVILPIDSVDDPRIAVYRDLKSAFAKRRQFLFGSEGFGLEPSWIEMCGQRVTIPMHRGVDSLNVSVAAGIFLHYFASSRT